MTPANAEQHAAWNGDSGQRWVASADRRDAVLAPIADLLLDTAAIAEGERVLDIGCGCGATTIYAAEATGPAGHVVGVDLSGPMLGVARQRAHQAHPVDFRQADVQTSALDGPFDVALSRFGTMFFDDPTAAFTNIARHLAPGGRLCIATWQPLAANQWLVVPGAALRDVAALPTDTDAGRLGMFAQCDPEVVRGVLTDAGFDAVTSAPHTVPLRFGATPDEASDYLTDSGPGRTILDTVPPDRRDEAFAAVGDALRPHHDPERGVVLDTAILITTGRAWSSGPQS